MGKRDLVRLVGLNQAEVSFFKKPLPGSNSLFDVFIRINDTGELLVLEKALGFGPNHNLQAIEFGDGRVVEWDSINWNNVGLFTALPELVGGSGNDTYVFGRGYGHDYITSSDAGLGKRDAVRLVGLTLAEVEFGSVYESGTYQDIIIRIKDTGETLTIDGAIKNSSDHNSYGLEAIELGDGTMMEWADFERAGLLSMRGTEGNDGNLTAGRVDTKIYGYGGDDRLTGGTGNDSLEGGAGDDTYIFRVGDGQDTINNSGGGEDLLKFADVNPADLWFEKSGYHLLIGLVGTEDRVTVSNWYYGNSYSIDTIEAGGYAVAETQVAQMVQALAAVGAPAGVNGQWTEEQRESLAPVLAAHWQPTI